MECGKVKAKTEFLATFWHLITKACDVCGRILVAEGHALQGREPVLPCSNGKRQAHT